jgi:hypothetical protein
MDTPREPHLTDVKRILRYLYDTLDYDLLRPSSHSELVVYTDADWAGCPDTRWSSFWLRRVLGCQPPLLVLEAAVRRDPLWREAEYRAVASGMASWLRQLL